MKITLFKLKNNNLRNKCYEYVIHLYDKNYVIYYHQLNVYISTIDEKNSILQTFKNLYDIKISKITNNEYEMLLSKDITIIKMTILKILNDNYEDFYI